MLGAGDEVGERVHLVLEPAVLVPLATHLAAAAHVRDREDEPAVEQREPRRPERRVGRDLVGAVAVEQRGRGAVERRVAPVHERDRDLRAVGRRRPESRRHVLRRVVAAEHGLRLHDGGAAVVHVVVDVGDRRDERRVAVAQCAGLELGVAARPTRCTPGRASRSRGSRPTPRAARAAARGRSRARSARCDRRTRWRRRA